MPFLNNIHVDRISFLLGFSAGIVFFLLALFVRKFLPRAVKSVQYQYRSTRDKFTTSSETRLRNDIVRQSQKQHLTSLIFSLDEIALEPKLIAPAPLLNYHKIAPAVDPVQITIPYIPDWPELAATYHAPTLSIIEALSGGANLAILGHPGSGKTFALAWLATRIARNDHQIENLLNLTPIYFHAAEISTLKSGDRHDVESDDLPIPTPTVDIPENQREMPDRIVSIKNLVVDLVTIISRYASPLTQPRLYATIRKALEEKRVILIVDGFDELTVDHIQSAFDFLSALFGQYPGNRLVIAASFDCKIDFANLDLLPVAMAAWGDDYKEAFVDIWNRQWQRLVIPNYRSSPRLDYESTFLVNWLNAKTPVTSPFEWILKVWGAYAGDLIGVDEPDLIESFIMRLSAWNKDSHPQLGQLAIQMLVSEKIRMHPSEVTKLLSGHATAESSTGELTLPSERDNELHELGEFPGHIPISKFIDIGLLTMHPDGEFSFAHQLLIGYLAGKRLAQTDNILLLETQSNWVGKQLTLYYLSFFGDIAGIVQYQLEHDDILNNILLNTARYLRIAPISRSWRSQVLRAIASSLTSGNVCLTLGAKFITALSFSNDQNVAILFRQMLKSEHGSLRQLAAFGSGMVRDTKAVPEITNLIEDGDPNFKRSACLALVEIGTKDSLGIVESLLMHGSELTRKAAAEALANHIQEGHPILSEGSRHGDVLVKHAVVSGLTRINQPWARQLLNEIQMEEEEWVVRNAAIQAIEELTQENPYVPHPIPLLTDAVWLAEYAQRQGIAVQEGARGEKLLLQTLSNGTEDERLAVLEYISLRGKLELSSEINKVYFEQSGNLREAAAQALWFMFLRGIKMPSTQYFTD